MAYRKDNKYKMIQDKRLDFGYFVDRAFWGLLTTSVIYGTMQVKQLSNSVEELNIKMAVVLEKISSQESRLEKLEERKFK
jgi:hypothetical protein